LSAWEFLKFGSIEKTPGVASLVPGGRSPIGATPTGLKAVPQPGASGFVGAVGLSVVPPALMMYCVPATPFDV